MKGKVPSGALRAHLRRITQPFSLDRRTERDERVAGGGESYEYDAVSADLYCYGESGSQEIASVGEVERGSMTGLALSEEDVQVGDRLDYGTRRYEVVEPIRYVPEESDRAVIQFPLERVDP